MYYTISKLLGVLVDPALLVTLLVLAGIAVRLLRRRRLAAWLWGAGAALILLFGVVPAGTWLALPLENRFPADPDLPPELAGIIVLAGAERVDASANWHQPEIGDPATLVALAALGRRYPAARLVFSGGVHGSDDPSVSEGSIVRDFYARLGIDSSRILFEERSRNTHESGELVGALLAPQPGQRWLLVTAALAMPRAVGVFRRAGFDVVAVPAGYVTGSAHPDILTLDLGREFILARLALHEWVGLVAYRALGYTNALFPH